MDFVSPSIVVLCDAHKSHNQDDEEGFTHMNI